MIQYKYKLYKTRQIKHLDMMMREGAFVWNHALALQRRHYSLYKKYIPLFAMQKHFAKRISRKSLNAVTVQEILERLDMGYKRFFQHISKRPPKFKKAKEFRVLVFKRTAGCIVNDNKITINKIGKTYKFSLSRPIDAEIKRILLHRNGLGEYFISFCLNKNPNKFEKSHNGASVGMDFGLKKYFTLSTGEEIDNPLFLSNEIKELRRIHRNLSNCQRGSNNKARKLQEMERLFLRIVYLRRDFQWKLAHNLCKRFDTIFIEDLQMETMKKRWGRKISDLAHNEFTNILTYVASKYDVTIHKIDRYYPSSKTCECGYIHNGLRLSDRTWICPKCGCKINRDLNAAKNILRRGIYELESENKTLRNNSKRLSHWNPTNQTIAV